MKENEYLNYRIITEMHKIEKGLSMPNFRPDFGKKTRSKIKKLIQFKKPDYIKTKAIELLEMNNIISTNNAPNYNSTVNFSNLIKQRRSIRNFSNKPLSNVILESIVNLASNSPSACNRQPYKVHIYRNPIEIIELLRYQNGNEGFGQNIPCLLIITFDRSAYYSSSERNLGYIDSALFAMNIVYAAQDKGVGSCLLNLSNYFYKEILLSKKAKISPNEALVVMIALGYPNDNNYCIAPFKKEISEIQKFHS